MLKVEILMNEEKVKAENIYDLTEMYQVIDTAFAKYNLPKIAKGTYVDNKSKDDFGAMWGIIWALIETDWFVPNTLKLLWYNSNGSDNESDYSVEDVLAYCKEKGYTGGPIC